MEFPTEQTECVHVFLEIVKCFVGMGYVVVRTGPEANYIVDKATIKKDVVRIFL